MYLKREPPMSLPKAAFDEELLLHARAARKDSAVHVSLSSDSLVKEPGEQCPPTYVIRRLNFPPPIDFGCTSHRTSLRSFRGTPSHRGGGAPCRPLYAPSPPIVNPIPRQKSRAVDNSPRGLTGLVLHTWGGPLQASNTQADMVRSSLISRPRAVLPPQCRALCSR